LLALVLAQGQVLSQCASWTRLAVQTSGSPDRARGTSASPIRDADLRRQSEPTVHGLSAVTPDLLVSGYASHKTNKGFPVRSPLPYSRSALWPIARQRAHSQNRAQSHPVPPPADAL